MPGWLRHGGRRTIRTRRAQIGPQRTLLVWQWEKVQEVPSGLRRRPLKCRDGLAMPNRSALRFTLFLLLSWAALAADQVVLTNGDTITGTIVKKDGGKLTIDRKSTRLNSSHLG